METIKITIPIEPVTKKNSQRIITPKNSAKPIVIPSKVYTDYENYAGYYLNRYSRLNINTSVNIEAHFFVKTRRKYDLTNLLEALDDTLVKYHVIADDNYLIVSGHDGSRVHYDKENPRTEIIITAFASKRAKIDGVQQ